MQIELANREDLKEILELQKLAFYEEAVLYNDFNIQPLNQTLKEINKEFEKKLFIKGIIDGRIIGSARSEKIDDICYIYKVIVHTNYRNQGIGKLLMKEIEKINNDAKKYELFTGYKSKRNIYFYKKLGYTKTDNLIAVDNVHFVTMFKINN